MKVGWYVVLCAVLPTWPVHLLHLAIAKPLIWTEKIQTRKIPDDVAEFFAHNIKNLPVDIKIALGCLSCLGNSTDFEVLNLIEADLNIKLIEPLRLAVDEGHVSEVDGRFCFVHDRGEISIHYSLRLSTCLYQTHPQRQLQCKTPCILWLGTRIVVCIIWTTASP